MIIDAEFYVGSGNSIVVSDNPLVRHMAIWIWVIISSGKGLQPDSTKPFPEPALPSHQWVLVTLAQVHVHAQDTCMSLQWRHNGRDSVSNHQPHDCLFNRLFRRRSKKTSKLRVTGLCEGNSPVTGGFPAQMASNAENVSIWWRHHELNILDMNWNSLNSDNSFISPRGNKLTTHWGRDKMAAIFRTKFSNGFSWMKMYEFLLKFHWSLFLRA